MSEIIKTDSVVKQLTLSEKKKVFDDFLNVKQLQLQGICKDMPADDNLASTIAFYKKSFLELQEKRKEFTSEVTLKLVTPYITKENEYAIGNYEPFKKMVLRELQVRQAKNLQVASVNALNMEINDYTLHCLNEHDRVLGERKIAMYNEVAIAVTANAMADVTGRALLRESLLEISMKPNPFAKFKRTLITDAKALDINKELKKPNYNSVIEEMMQEAERLHLLPKTELQSAISVAVKDVIADVVNEQSNNAIASKHTPVTMVAPKIKRERIIVIEETKEFAVKIMSAFIQQDVAWLMLDKKVKTFEKLTVTQMANALAKCYDITVSGVTYKDVEK